LKREVIAVVTGIVVAWAAAARTRAVTPVPAPPTFSREIDRIFQGKCESCHSPGGVAPFSLVSYRDAFAHALPIKLMTATRKMPPWKPAKGCGDFLDARQLSDSEIRTIGAWVDAGAPEGDPRELPPPVVIRDDWKIGVPDLVLTPTEAFTPPKDADTFRCFVLPGRFSTDLYVKAVDIRPEARDYVHHAELLIDTTGRAQQLDDADPLPGFDIFAGGLEIPFGLLGAWLPDSEPFMLPDDVATKIPSGAALVLAVHYHPHDGKIVTDKTAVGLYLAHKPIEKIAKTASFYVDQIDLPAGASDIVVQTTKPVEEAMEVYAVRAHMHYLGRSISGVAVQPDGARDCLLTVNDWDIHWQGTYRYSSPLLIPAGTRIEVTGHYDNSVWNPANPSFPPREVFGGYRANDEMCGIELVYAPADQRVFILP